MTNYSVKPSLSLIKLLLPIPVTGTSTFTIGLIAYIVTEAYVLSWLINPTNNWFKQTIPYIPYKNSTLAQWRNTFSSRGSVFIIAQYAGNSIDLIPAGWEPGQRAPSENRTEVSTYTPYNKEFDLVLVDNQQTPITRIHADAGDPVRRNYGNRRLNTSTDVVSTVSAGSRFQVAKLFMERMSICMVSNYCRCSEIWSYD